MTMIETVRGPLQTGSLGRTLMHEHIFVINPEIATNYPEAWNEDVRRRDALSKLRALEGWGVDSLVDLTVIGLGRDVARIVELQAQTSVTLLVATGVYTYRDLPLYFHFRGPGRLIDGPEIITGLLVKDITEGIGDTGVRAAILKCATDTEGITPDIDRTLRAVSWAHRETGVPITTHTHAATRRGLEQQDIFAEEGVELSRVIIGHCGDTDDLDYLREVMARGSYIGMDRFGLDLLLPTAERVDTVVRLVAEGYAGQMLLSTDAPCWSHNWDEHVRQERLPNWNWNHLFADVIPALLRAGVSHEEVDQMMVRNPRDIFERIGRY